MSVEYYVVYVSPEGNDDTGQVISIPSAIPAPTTPTDLSYLKQLIPRV